MNIKLLVFEGFFNRVLSPQKLAPTWDELAKAFEKDEGVKIAKVDCTQAQSVCQDYDVRGYPTLAYFKDGKKVETYRGARYVVIANDALLTQLA